MDPLRVLFDDNPLIASDEIFLNETLLSTFYSVSHQSSPVVHETLLFQFDLPFSKREHIIMSDVKFLVKYPCIGE